MSPYSKGPCLTPPHARKSALKKSELLLRGTHTDNEMPVLEVTITKPTTDTKCVR